MYMLWNISHDLELLTQAIDRFQFGVNDFSKYFYRLSAYKRQSVDKKRWSPTHPGRESKIEVSFNQIHVIIIFQACIESRKI